MCGGKEYLQIFRLRWHSRKFEQRREFDLLHNCPIWANVHGRLPVPLFGSVYIVLGCDGTSAHSSSIQREWFVSANIFSAHLPAFINHILALSHHIPHPLTTFHPSPPPAFHLSTRSKTNLPPSWNRPPQLPRWYPPR